MKYVRTKDERIVEKSKLEPGLKQTFITITRKSDNKELAQINVDYSSDYIDMVTVCEYCRCHRINPKDIKYETATLFNDVLKQADTIEELIDGWVLESKAYYKSGFFVIYNTEDNKQIMEKFKLLKDEKLFAFIKTDKGLIYVAKMNEKGVLELL